MPDDTTLTARPWHLSISTWTVVFLGGLIVWGYARSGPTPRAPKVAIAPVATAVPNEPLVPASIASDEDVRGVPAAGEKPPTGRLIETLRQQIAQSPLLGEADAQSSLMDSLDQAGTIWTRTQRQNREALRQLKRQVRIGESRQSPHLVLVTFDRASAIDDADSPREKLFADLAQRGMNFRQHYAGGESPTSGWWTLMTGRNTGRARTEEARFQLRESEPNVAAALWQAGYATGFLGVWHDRIAPLDTGFDDWTGWQGASNNVPHFPKVLQTSRTKMSIRANEEANPSASLWQLLTVEIESFVANRAAESRPFFLQVRLPELADISSTATDDSAESVVNRLLECLQKAGMDRRTCVFITALSGRESATSPLLTEDALRVPLVMVGGPQITAGAEVNAATTAWDVFPTMLEIAQSTRRVTATDGQSLLSIAKGDSSHSHRLLYWETDRTGLAQAVRKGEWKGAAKAGDRQLRLYHLPTDPNEEKNVAADHPDVVKELLAPAPPADSGATKSAKSDPS